jgi:hypothetical protein
MSQSILGSAWADHEAQVIINEVLAHFGDPRLRELVATRLQRARIRGLQMGLGVAAEAVGSLKPGAPAVDLASVLEGLDA